MRFVDLFAGLGGFHIALKDLGHDCVFASEIDDELRDLYIVNHRDSAACTFGDIRTFRDRVPPHDILCAGFPCQPFSKSGTQRGLHDTIRGTLFDEVVYVLERNRPEYVILENVGNFERHDNGRTWSIVKEKLIALGYDVKGTEHIASGGTGLLSPHHFGYPHSRERFFIVAKLGHLPPNPFPVGDRLAVTSLASIVQRSQDLTVRDRHETLLSERQTACIEHWNQFLLYSRQNNASLPSFPIWGDEIDATYPFEDYTPFAASLQELRKATEGGYLKERLSRDEMIARLPSYARSKTSTFPEWKIRFIRQNREWFKEMGRFLPAQWKADLRTFPSSLRKLEWNCQGEEPNLWRYVLQFRPSGLRAKRYSTSPALVAMTSTQIPILGPHKRFLTRKEGLRLQGFPSELRLPESRERSFRALGNAVHVEVVKLVADCLINGTSTRPK